MQNRDEIKMSRIDQPCGDFVGINAVSAAQKEVQKLLKATSSVTNLNYSSTTLRSVLQEFKNIMPLVKSDYQVYALFETAFGPGSNLEKWVKEKLPKDESYGLAMSNMMPANDLHAKLANAGNMAYTSDYYKDRVKSQWLKNTLGNDSYGPESQAVAGLVEDFIRNERELTSMSASARVVFNDVLMDLKDQDTLTNLTNRADVKKDIQTITNYLNQLDVRREDYDNLELHKLLIPNQQTMPDAIHKLCEKYQSQEYGAYQKKLNELSPSIIQIRKILEKSGRPHVAHDKILGKQQFMSTSYTSTFTKLHKALEAANKLNLIEEVDHARDTAEQRLASAFATIKFDTLLRGLDDKSDKTVASVTGVKVPGLSGTGGKSGQQLAVLGGLIFDNKSSPPTTSTEQLATGIYLEKLLCVAFPTVFKKTEGDSFQVNENPRAIYAAIGGKPKPGEHLDPQKFDVDLLTKLETQPLGTLLKAIKPIDETFTLLDKVNAYQEVMQLTAEGKLHFNDKAASKQSYRVGEEIFKIVKDVPLTAEFTLEQKIDVYKELFEQAKKGTFKFDDQTFSMDRAREIGHKIRLLVEDTPIDRHFTLADKVEVYKNLIRDINDGQLELSNESSLTQAREIAQIVLDLVTNRVEPIPIIIKTKTYNPTPADIRSNKKNMEINKQRAVEDTPALLAHMKEIYDLIESKSLLHGMKKGLTNVTGFGEATGIRENYLEYVVSREDDVDFADRSRQVVPEEDESVVEVVSVHSDAGDEEQELVDAAEEYNNWAIVPVDTAVTSRPASPEVEVVAPIAEPEVQPEVVVTEKKELTLAEVLAKRTAEMRLKLKEGRGDGVDNSSSIKPPK